MKKILPILFLMIMTTSLMPLSSPRAQEEDPVTVLQHFATLDSGPVKEILKSDMIMLQDNKRYKLDNILVPPYEEAPAIEALKQAFIDKTVTIYSYHDDEDSYDRNGVPLAHVIADKDIWLQQYMVSKGLAWAFSTPTSTRMVDTLKQVEEEARNQGLGFWKNPAYAVKMPDDVGSFKNTYQIVEGKIVSVSVSQRAIYFNFGKDWKNSFTAKLPVSFDSWYQAQGDKTRAQNSNPRRWKDRVVRVRGWVVDDHGRPMIELTHKEQIDILHEAKKSPDGKK